MSERPSRRGLICEAALDLAAEGGPHAVTHQRIDARIGVATGSTSYYYRTRRALVGAAIAHLTSLSRGHFDRAVSTGPHELPGSSEPPGSPGPRASQEPEVSADSAAELIADHVEELLAARSRDVSARYALIAETADDEELRADLAASLFSLTAATLLFEALGAMDADAAARDLLSLLEGVVFDYTFGRRSPPTDERAGGRRERIRAAVRLWVEALATAR